MKEPCAPRWTACSPERPSTPTARLTVKNLAVEAAIPRSTLYRAEPRLLREFERRLQHTQDAAQPVGGGLAARVARPEAKLAATERRAAGYRDDLEQERRRSRPRQPSRPARRGATQARRPTHDKQANRVPGRPPPALENPRRELI